MKKTIIIMLALLALCTPVFAGGQSETTAAKTTATNIPANTGNRNNERLSRALQTTTTTEYSINTKAANKLSVRLLVCTR